MAVCAAGCGTTRWSDTSRTATEQMLLSTAVDRAVSDIDFSPLAGKDIFFDDTYLKGTVDSPYIVATLRQQLLAAGCLLKSDRKDATYIVEARAGGVGTNRHDVMLGVPAFSVPSVIPTAAAGLPQMPAAVPEIPFAKMTDQKGVAKLAVFAYNQKTGLAVWQSGAFPIVTNAKDSWILGLGPVQRGSIYSRTKFAGNGLIFSGARGEDQLLSPRVPVTAEAVFTEEPPPAKVEGNAPNAVQPTGAAQAPGAVQQAAATLPAGPPAAAATPAAATTPVNSPSPAPAKTDPPAVPAAPAAPAASKAPLFPNGPPQALIRRLPPTEVDASHQADGVKEVVRASDAVPQHLSPRRAKFSLLSPSTWFRGTGKK